MIPDNRFAISGMKNLGDINMNFADRDGVIWFDGEFVNWRDAKVHVLTHTLHYGMGFYEGIRVYETEQGPAAFRLNDHIDRFFNSSKILNMPLSFTKTQLNEAAIEVVRQNKLSSAYIRPLCFYGSEAMGLHADDLTSHVIIAAWQWGEYLGKGAIENGIKVQTSSFARIGANSILSKAKACGHYINSMLALQEAKASGCDEALMLDHHGYIAEGSGENFFMVRDGKVSTPPLTAALEGITRDTVIRYLRDLDIPCVERNITRDEVYIADEAFFTGTAAEITPITMLDGRQIGEGKPGKITRQIQQLYFETVRGQQDAYKEWLSAV